MLVIRQQFISRSDLRANPQVLYIFGDNLAREGMGGQAKNMRGEPNAFGIATKARPSHGHPDDYFHDYIKQHRILVDQDFDKLEAWLRSDHWNAVVIPMDGIGTGLAKLQHFAPALLTHINHRLSSLKDCAHE